jgi:energy-coupling factor transporter transmembrane protein EcfT
MDTMKDKTLTKNLSELNHVIKSYIDARIDLWKINLLDKIVKSGTYFFTSVMVMLALSFVLLFATFAFSYWYGNVYGNIATGFLISAGFYIILGIVFYFFRKPIFSNNIIRNIAEIIFSEDDRKINE